MSYTNSPARRMVPVRNESSLRSASALCANESARMFVSSAELRYAVSV
jgi:hypothetical protein